MLNLIHAESSIKNVIGGQVDKERGAETTTEPSTELHQQNDAGPNTGKEDKAGNNAVTVQPLQESSHADSFVEGDVVSGEQGPGGTNVGQQAVTLLEHPSGSHVGGTDSGQAQQHEPNTRANPVVNQEKLPSGHSTTNNIPEARVSPSRETVQTNPKVQGWTNKEVK